jgi:hypothetical protein
MAYQALALQAGQLQVRTQSWQAKDWPALLTQVGGLAEQVEILHTEAAPFFPLLPYLAWLPGYGADLQAAPQLLGAGYDLSQAVQLVLAAMPPASWAGTTAAEVREPDQLARSLARLRPAQADLRGLVDRLRARQAGLATMQIEALSPKMQPYARLLVERLPTIVDGLAVITALPKLLGVDSPRTYLILASNSDELRPTGGYITAAGHLTFNGGHLTEFVMQDSYAVDRLSESYPYPPQPLYEYMAADYWVLRDVSWSPDFPAAARQAIELYELGRGLSADGVISFDQQALVFLLQGLGPVKVEGQTVNSENVIKLMRQNWAPDVGQGLDRAWWLERKSFMVALGEAVEQKLEAEVGPAQLPALAQGLGQAAREKHLLIYLEPWAEQISFLNQPLPGALATVSGDYLMIVDANLGFNKASAGVARHLAYQVRLQADGGAQAQATVSYRHQVPKRGSGCDITIRYDPVNEQNIQRCYWNYVRLVAPQGAELLHGPAERVEARYLLRGQATSGALDVEPVGPDKVSWGQLTLLPPAESLTLRYDYRLPAQTARPVTGGWEYRLCLQKQPGTLKTPADVSLTLPAGAELIDSQPAPLRRHDNILLYEFSLQTDQHLLVRYR